jgi:hypothetical protein
LNEQRLASTADPNTTTLQRIKRLFLGVLLPLAVVLLIATEVILVIKISHASIFSLKPPFAQDALIVGGDYVPTGCDNIQEMFQEAKAFFHNSALLNLDNVLTVYRGTPFKKTMLPMTLSRPFTSTRILVPGLRCWCMRCFTFIKNKLAIGAAAEVRVRHLVSLAIVAADSLRKILK